MSSKYKRPYCEKCKLIWRGQSIGRVLNCSKCGNLLVLKSFNPWIKGFIGIATIFLGTISILSEEMPVIWIGGFLLGGSLIINSIKQWSEVKGLDEDRSREKRKNDIRESTKHLVITCGRCFEKIPVLKGGGLSELECPKCFNKFKVKT